LIANQTTRPIFVRGSRSRSDSGTVCVSMAVCVCYYCRLYLFGIREGPPKGGEGVKITRIPPPPEKISIILCLKFTLIGLSWY
jgi:hypothetical protein